jgi:hypothetical protein
MDGLQEAALDQVTGLAALNFYPRELEDIEMLRRLAAHSGRRLVLEPDAALIAGRFFGDWPAVYVPVSRRYAGPERLPWLGEVLRHCPLVSRADMRAAPGGYLVQVGLPHILERFDLASDGGAYLQIGGVPMGDLDPAYATMTSLAERAGFRFVKFDEFTNMRHSPPAMVQYYVEAVNPRVLIPAHGLRPERLRAKRSRRLFPAYGKTYRLRDGELLET